MSRGESRQYWTEQLSEYWDSGSSIQEYCELKELSFKNTKRWIRVFEIARLFFGPLNRRPDSRLPRGSFVKEQDVLDSKSTEGEGEMAAYAKIYGFQVVNGESIQGREDDFTWLDGNCYLSNSDYEILEEIINKEF